VVWVGDTFGATGDDPTGAVRVGETFGATEGGLATPEDPPTAEGEETEPPDLPGDDPLDDAPPPPEEPPDDEPDCARATAGIRRAAAKIKMRMTCHSNRRHGSICNTFID
jgi:hypothetical protein